MGKLIKVKKSDIRNILKMVISEQEFDDFRHEHAVLRRRPVVYSRPPTPACLFKCMIIALILMDCPRKYSGRRVLYGLQISCVIIITSYMTREGHGDVRLQNTRYRN